MEGFVKLHRKLVDWEWYSDANTMRVFLHLLLTANFRPKKFKGINVGAGQVLVGRKALAERLGMSEQSVRTAINHLKSTNEITTKVTKYGSLVTVENWAKYQLADTESTVKTTDGSTPSQPLPNQLLTTTKERKNVRMKEEYIIPPTLDMVKAYVQERKNGIDPEDFWNFYESKGWLVGKSKMKNWHSAMHTWERNRKSSPQPTKNIEPPKYKRFEKEEEVVDAVPMPEEIRAKMKGLFT